MSSEVTRRRFVKSGAAVAGVATSLASSRAVGANDRIRLGFIGVANRGGQLINATLPHKDAEIVAVSDVYSPKMDEWAEKLPGDVAKYGDFRKIIERDDIDGVVIGTPDHWHAIQCIMACDAGKDVYVEKPLSITIKEGRRMVEAARRNDRIVQVGTHRRSSELLYRLADLIRADTFGKITVARAYRISNMWPDGIGKEPESDPPPELNWDMWLGPRPYRPFQANIAPYKFRWWQQYSSQTGNWGVHYFDLFRWVLDEKAPCSVVALGGKFAIDDDRTIPDTMEAVFEFPSGRLVTFGQYEASNTHIFAKGGEFELRGSKGCVFGSGSGFTVVPERGGQFQSSDPRMEPMEEKAKGNNHNLTTQHMRNFLDCMKSREKPNADVEEGHRSTVMSHLANIALTTRTRIDWDPDKEEITNNKAANKLLHYEYRKPWKLG
ncbi:MAG: Gfo/Idh/MocA family oxidoreductase, partial [bacterium]|nr:Gfo/Idh/MocA family oxidoreductase [bacterium]